MIFSRACNMNKCNFSCQHATKWIPVSYNYCIIHGNPLITHDIWLSDTYYANKTKKENTNTLTFG